jgi:signal peptidase
MALKKILKNPYIVYFLILIIIILGVAAFWFTLRFAYQTEYPLLAVDGHSMEPTLLEGDLIIIQGGLNASNIKVGYKNSNPEGDIIVFYKPGATSDQKIVHRAVKNGTDEHGFYIITRGDNVQGDDPWKVRPQHIIGKVVGRAPVLGRVALALQDPFWRLVVILALIALIAIDLTYSSIKKKEKTPQENVNKPALYVMLR